MSLEVFDKAVETFITTLKFLGLKNATISLYGGETLANKKVIKECLLKFGSVYKEIELKWVINTNGSLLKEEDIIFFKNNNLEIHISIDGKEEIHNISRPTHKGKGTFHLVTPALELIKAHQAPAQINSYMMPSNFNDLKDIVDIAEKYNIRKFYLDQFYNLDMITHKVGMEKYMSVYLYGMKKGVEISGPWSKVIKNFQQKESRESFLNRSISLDVNIDGSCYFPIFNESKIMNYHIDNILEFFQNNGWKEIVSKTLARNIKTCEDCFLKESCFGTAIEQVHYHIGLEADSKVSCHFFKDWCGFLMRPIFFKKLEKADFISMIELDSIEQMVLTVNQEIKNLEKILWPLRNRITVNVLEHYDEMLLSSKIDELPIWVTAVTNGSNLYLKGVELSPALIHELTHIFLNQEKISAPKWFIEGFCEWVQGNLIDFNLLEVSLKKNNLFEKELPNTDLPIDSFDNQRPGENSQYVQAHAFVKYLESMMGKDLLKQIVLATVDLDLSIVLELFTGISLENHIENFLKITSKQRVS
jgi:sulfatase maturation enzyme AslB (radical SAM superfamily)